MEQVAAGPILSKSDYYKDTSRANFSGVKLFSRCETLYRDTIITGAYEEPDHDYFVYGKLVDALVSEGPEFIEKNFIRVERRLNPEDALRLENELRRLEEEALILEGEVAADLDTKRSAIQAKIDALGLDADSDKMAKFRAQLEAIEPNKTKSKGIESRRAAAAECQARLAAIKALADKVQVTGALWVNAEETAAAIKAHPSYPSMVWDATTSQQIFLATLEGIPCKGRLDHLLLSPAIRKVYALYIAKQLTLEDMKARIAEMNPNDHWAVITDVKTGWDIRKLEPWSTHYRGQLGFYQDLVADFFGIPQRNIRCRILYADKLNNALKHAELFEYPQEAIDELKPDVRAWMRLWYTAYTRNIYVSDKEKKGIDQTCFTCTECRFCPFSRKPGEPVIVTGPRFGERGQGKAVQQLVDAMQEDIKDIVGDY